MFWASAFAALCKDRKPLPDPPLSFLDDGHLAHGYATTVHKAQGMTCGVAFLLGDDGLFAELGYTGLARGREANRLYIVRGEWDHGRGGEETDELAHIDWSCPFQ